MGLKKIYEKIDKRLNLAPKRTLDFNNNIIAGIIGGAIIYYFIILKTVENIFAGFWFVIILWAIGLLAVYNSTKETRYENSRRKQIKNYLWNSLAALIGGFYLIGIYNWSWKPWNLIISTLSLIILFIGIMYFRNKR